MCAWVQVKLEVKPWSWGCRQALWAVPHECWEPNVDPVGQQYMLLSVESCLQSPNSIFVISSSVDGHQGWLHTVAVVSMQQYTGQAGESVGCWLWAFLHTPAVVLLFGSGYADARSGHTSLSSQQWPEFLFAVSLPASVDTCFTQWWSNRWDGILNEFWFSFPSSCRMLDIYSSIYWPFLSLFWWAPSRKSYSGQVSSLKMAHPPCPAAVGVLWWGTAPGTWSRDCFLVFAVTVLLIHLTWCEWTQGDPPAYI